MPRRVFVSVLVFSRFHFQGLNRQQKVKHLKNKNGWSRAKGCPTGKGIHSKIKVSSHTRVYTAASSLCLIYTWHCIYFQNSECSGISASEFGFTSDFKFKGMSVYYLQKQTQTTSLFTQKSQKYSWTLIVMAKLATLPPSSVVKWMWLSSVYHTRWFSSSAYISLLVDDRMTAPCSKVLVKYSGNSI